MSPTDTDFSPFFPRKVIGEFKREKNIVTILFSKEVFKIGFDNSFASTTVVGGKSVFQINIVLLPEVDEVTVRISRMKSKGGFHRI